MTIATVRARSRRMLALACMAAFTLSSGAALAFEGAAPASPATPYSGPSPMGAPSAGNLLQTILGLCLVLALLAALAWFARRYGPKASGASANLRVVGALNLGG